MNPTTRQLSAYRTLAFDYDGTLASRGRMASDVVSALMALRADGRRLVLVTGRTREDLGRACAELHLFDAVVAENGAVLCTSPDAVPYALAAPPPAHFVQALSGEATEVGAGRVILGIKSADARTAMALLEKHRLPWQLVFNKDAAMLVPPGIDKGTGLRQALSALRVAPAHAMAVGDAENDAPMLKTAGLGIATGNAIDALKAQADLVLSKDNGGGIVELVQEHVLV